MFCFTHVHVTYASHPFIQTSFLHHVYIHRFINTTKSNAHSIIINLLFRQLTESRSAPVDEILAQKYQYVSRVHQLHNNYTFFSTREPDSGSYFHWTGSQTVCTETVLTLVYCTYRKISGMYETPIKHVTRFSKGGPFPFHLRLRTFTTPLHHQDTFLNWFRPIAWIHVHRHVCWELGQSLLSVL